MPLPQTPKGKAVGTAVVRGAVSTLLSPSLAERILWW